MKHLKRTLIAVMFCVMLTFPVSAASIDSQIDAMKADLDQTVENAGKSLIKTGYDIGTVYTTTEDIDEQDMADMFGGEWMEINSAFLWATDGKDSYKKDEDGDMVDDNDGSSISPLYLINGRGGKSYYNLIAGIGTDEETFAFWTSDSSAYINDNDTVSLSGADAAASAIFTGMRVVEKTAENYNSPTEIMPPYTVVKMFERVA